MPIHINISGDTPTEVLSLMAGLVGGAPTPEAKSAGNVQKTELTENGSEEKTSDVPEKSSASPDSEPQSGADEPDVEVDSDGIPFDPEMHTGTKLKSGQWRMKSGVERPEPVTDEKPETAEETEEDDEFAAFKEAAAASDANEAEAAENVPARTWTDADLGQLCNDAAVKLNDPAPVKEIIAQFVPEGEVPHSRNIPADKREEFAQAVEEKAGIEYAG